MPAIRFSSVLLPEPDGPISATKSPSAISSEMSDSTGTVCAPRWYDLARWRIETRGSAMSHFLASVTLAPSASFSAGASTTVSPGFTP
jgi:hypothetical protein